MRASGIIALSVIVGLILVAAAAYVIKAKPTSEDILQASLSGIAECMGKKDAIECSRPFVKKLVDEKNGSEIMDALAAKLPPLRCHYVGHIVGQELYVKYQNIETAMASCSRACDVACIHGAAGEAFAEQLGLGTPEDDQQLDLEHLGLDELRTVGRALCTSTQACHGVGHALFQTTNNLGKAMSVCKDVGSSTTTVSCYNGVSMEYADVLSTRSVRPVSGVIYPDAESFNVLCDLPDSLQRRACFRYFPRIVIESLTSHGLSRADASDRVREFCASQTVSGDRSACFYAIGRNSSYLLTTDQQEALRVCGTLPHPRDEAACYFGEVDVATEDRPQELMRYCQALRTPSLQGACYQEVFNHLAFMNVLDDTSVQLCGGGATRCAQEFENYARDPWEEIQKNFAE